MIIATLTIASTLLLGQVAPKDIVDLFEAKEHFYTGGRYKHERFCYRLFVPRHLKPNEQCPLLVWLHGMGEGGPDNQQSLRYLDKVLDDPKHIEKYRFFILVVQCPSTNVSWFHQHGDVVPEVKKSDEMLSVVFEILQKTMREYPVASDQLYLIGICSGAAGCWEMAMRYPNLFAAMAPMATPGCGDVSRASKLINLPIWAFVSPTEQDNGVKDLVAAVRNAGGCVHLTVTRTLGHDSWSEPLRNGIMDWLLTQRRTFFRFPLGDPLRQWWHVLILPCALLVFIRLTWSFEQWRRRKASSIANLSEPESAEADFNIGPLE